MLSRTIVAVVFVFLSFPLYADQDFDATHPWKRWNPNTKASKERAVIA